MRQNNGARAATAEPPATAPVAPRFTRAAQAERSRLKDKREQLLRKREAKEAELGVIDCAVAGIDELLELLAPLLASNGSEPGAAGEGSSVGEERASGAERSEAHERDRVLPDQRQAAKE
jgi:hypothetical protein